MIMLFTLMLPSNGSPAVAAEDGRGVVENRHEIYNNLRSGIGMYLKGILNLTLRLRMLSEHLSLHPSMPLNVKSYSATATPPPPHIRPTADRAAAPRPSLRLRSARARRPSSSKCRLRFTRTCTPARARPRPLLLLPLLARARPRVRRRHLGNCPSESVSRRTLPAAAGAHYGTVAHLCH